MPITCLVVDCTSRSTVDDVKFFSVPAVLNHRFLTDKNELSVRRRAQWIAAIKRDDLTESKLKNQRVCSRHFITGRPAGLEEENHPDWVPSKYMRPKSQRIHRKQADVEKIGRLDKRRKLCQPIPDEDPNLESVGASAETVTTPTLKRAIPANTGTKRKGGPDRTNQLVELATEYFKRPETEEDILAKAWAMKLKKLAPDQRRFAEKIINDSLFEAEMGTLTAVRLNSCPRYPQSGQSKHTPVQSPSYQGQHHEMSHEENAATFFSSFTSM